MPSLNLARALASARLARRAVAAVVSSPSLLAISLLLSFPFSLPLLLALVSPFHFTSPPECLPSLPALFALLASLDDAFRYFRSFNCRRHRSSLQSILFTCCSLVSALFLSLSPHFAFQFSLSCSLFSRNLIRIGSAAFSCVRQRLVLLRFTCLLTATTELRDHVRLDDTGTAIHISTARAAGPAVVIFRPHRHLLRVALCSLLAKFASASSSNQPAVMQSICSLACWPCCSVARVPSTA